MKFDLNTFLFLIKYFTQQKRFTSSIECWVLSIWHFTLNTFFNLVWSKFLFKTVTIFTSDTELMVSMCNVTATSTGGPVNDIDKWLSHANKKVLFCYLHSLALRVCRNHCQRTSLIFWSHSDLNHGCDTHKYNKMLN